jgi:hypothetical protein
MNVVPKERIDLVGVQSTVIISDHSRCTKQQKRALQSLQGRSQQSTEDNGVDSDGHGADGDDFGEDG